jgi:hypothetical protein
MKLIALELIRNCFILLSFLRTSLCLSCSDIKILIIKLSKQIKSTLFKLLFLSFLVLFQAFIVIHIFHKTLLFLTLYSTMIKDILTRKIYLMNVKSYFAHPCARLRTNLVIRMCACVIINKFLHKRCKQK